MVDTIGGEEEHPGVILSSSTADGGTSVSREELNVALDTFKTSMKAEVKGMLKNFLHGLKLYTAPLEVVDPTNKVTDANSDMGKLVVIRLLYLVVEVEMASLPMLNLHLLMEDRFLHSFEPCWSSS